MKCRTVCEYMISNHRIHGEKTSSNHRYRTKSRNQSRCRTDRRHPGRGKKPHRNYQRTLKYYQCQSPLHHQDHRTRRTTVYRQDCNDHFFSKKRKQSMNTTHAHTTRGSTYHRRKRGRNTIPQRWYNHDKRYHYQSYQWLIYRDNNSTRSKNPNHRHRYHQL